MAKAELSSDWWDSNKPEGFKEKDLERALLAFENEKRGAEKNGDENSHQKVAKALDAVLKAIAKTTKSLDKEKDKDLIGELGKLKDAAGSQQRQSEMDANTLAEASGDRAELFKKKVELSSEWWSKLREGLGLKNRDLEKALLALENVHRGFERGAEGNWAKMLTGIQALLKAGVAKALKEAETEDRKKLAKVFTVLLALAQKDATERGAG